MKQELEQELKDAGFKFRPFGEPRDHYTQFGSEPPVHAPLLGELIEACGDKFYSLRTADGITWVAHPTEMLESLAAFAFSDEKSWSYNGSKGKSPEEAVARLWLVLQKGI